MDGWEMRSNYQMRMLIKAMEAFYKDPENRKAFKKWKKEQKRLKNELENTHGELK